MSNISLSNVGLGIEVVYVGTNGSYYVREFLNPIVKVVIKGRDRSDIDIIKSCIPGCVHGVYTLAKVVDGVRCRQYDGKTLNGLERLEQHLRDNRKDFNFCVMWLAPANVFPTGCVDGTEALLINTTASHVATSVNDYDEATRCWGFVIDNDKSPMKPYFELSKPFQDRISALISDYYVYLNSIVPPKRFETQPRLNRLFGSRDYANFEANFDGVPVHMCFASDSSHSSIMLPFGSLIVDSIDMDILSEAVRKQRETAAEKGRICVGLDGGIYTNMPINFKTVSDLVEFVTGKRYRDAWDRFIQDIDGCTFRSYITRNIPSSPLHLFECPDLKNDDKLYYCNANIESDILNDDDVNKFDLVLRLVDVQKSLLSLVKAPEIVDKPTKLISAAFATLNKGSVVKGKLIDHLYKYDEDRGYIKLSALMSTDNCDFCDDTDMCDAA